MFPALNIAIRDMQKSDYLYNTQYETLLGLWGTPAEQNLLVNLHNAEKGMWANQKPGAYLERIRPELITIINGLNHPNVSDSIRSELLLSIRGIISYQGVCTALDKIAFLVDDPEDEEDL